MDIKRSIFMLSIILLMVLQIIDTLPQKYCESGLSRFEPPAKVMLIRSDGSEIDVLQGRERSRAGLMFSLCSNGIVSAQEKCYAYGVDGRIVRLQGGSNIFIQAGKVFAGEAGMDNPILGLAVLTHEKMLADVRQMVELSVLKQKKSVMLVYVDGLGARQLKLAQKRGLVPVLSSLKEKWTAATVYQPVTNAGFAAMISGTDPKHNGVDSHAQQELRCGTVFDSLKRAGKVSFLLENDIGILKLDVPTVFNNDINGNGMKDDEVFISAMSACDENKPDFLLVHFHSLDDTNHQAGPSSEAALKQLALLDGYIGRLKQSWQGEIIVTADHGAHDTSSGGSHGDFCAADMFVPIMQDE